MLGLGVEQVVREVRPGEPDDAIVVAGKRNRHHADITAGAADVILVIAVAGIGERCLVDIVELLHIVDPVEAGGPIIVPPAVAVDQEDLRACVGGRIHGQNRE